MPWRGIVRTLKIHIPRRALGAPDKCAVRVVVAFSSRTTSKMVAMLPELGDSLLILRTLLPHPHPRNHWIHGFRTWWSPLGQSSRLVLVLGQTRTIRTDPVIVVVAVTAIVVANIPIVDAKTVPRANRRVVPKPPPVPRPVRC